MASGSLPHAPANIDATAIAIPIAERAVGFIGYEYVHSIEPSVPLPVRDELGVSARSLSILQEAMVADTEDPEGTGHRAAVPGLRICGKTGTAQIQDEHNRKIGQTTWFISFAPYCPPGSAEKPRWAVVVMVENGKSGGSWKSVMSS